MSEYWPEGDGFESLPCGHEDQRDCDELCEVQ